MQTGQWVSEARISLDHLPRRRKGLLKISLLHCNSDFFYFFCERIIVTSSFASTNHFSSSLNRNSFMPAADHDRITDSAAAHLRGRSPAFMLQRSISYTRPSIHRIRRGGYSPLHPHPNSQVHILFYISVPIFYASSVNRRMC